MSKSITLVPPRIDSPLGRLPVGHAAATSSVSDPTLLTRIRYSEFNADVDFDGTLIGGLGFKSEPDLNFSSGGVEVGLHLNEFVEVFADLGGGNAENNDNPAKVEGAEVGIGLRSAAPSQPGLGVDFGARYCAYVMDGENSGLDEEIIGTGSNAHLGGAYSLPLGDALLLTPSAGIMYLERRGDYEAELLGVKVADADFEVFSWGIYTGLRLNTPSLRHLECMVRAFVGTEDVQGIRFILGYRF